MNPDSETVFFLPLFSETYANNYSYYFLDYRSGRYASEPIKGLTSLTEEPYGPGFGVKQDL